MIKKDDFSANNFRNMKGIGELVKHVFDDLNEMFGLDMPSPEVIDSRIVEKISRGVLERGTSYHNDNLGLPNGFGSATGSPNGFDSAADTASAGAGSPSTGSGNNPAAGQNPMSIPGAYPNANDGLIIEFSIDDSKREYYGIDINSIEDIIQQYEEKVFGKFDYPNKITIYYKNIEAAGKFEARLVGTLTQYIFKYYYSRLLQRGGIEWDPNLNSTGSRYIYPEIIEKSLATYYELLKLDNFSHIFSDMPIIKQEIIDKFSRKVVFYPYSGAKLITDKDHFVSITLTSCRKGCWTRTMSRLLRIGPYSAKNIESKLVGI